MRQLLSSRSAIADKSDSSASSQLWVFLPQIKGAAEKLSISVKFRASRKSFRYPHDRTFFVSSSSSPWPDRTTPTPTRHQFQEMALFPCSAEHRPLSPSAPLSDSLDSLSLSFPFSHLLKLKEGTGESLSVTAT